LTPPGPSTTNLEPTVLTPEVWFDQKDEEVLISIYFLEFTYLPQPKKNKMMDLFIYFFQLIDGAKIKYWKAL
jgi:hypothetical protein